jgi:uncharacterized protein (DUF3084 family)
VVVVDIVEEREVQVITGMVVVAADLMAVLKLLDHGLVMGMSRLHLYKK